MFNRYSPTADLREAEKEEKERTAHSELPDEVSAIFDPWFEGGASLRKDLVDMAGKRFTFKKHARSPFWVCLERPTLSKIKIEWMKEVKTEITESE